MTPLALTVAISISEPEDSELAARGLALDHVNHAYIEIARQILAAGGSLAYGGSPRASEPNYVRILIALLRTYSKPARPPSERIQIYLAAPIWTTLTAADRAGLQAFATLKEIPTATREPSAASDFTAMRAAMTAESDGRVVLGGRLKGPFAGPWPGIVEESHITLQAREPLYVVGGLGGAASLVADLLRGRRPPIVELANAQELADAFRHADLHNGLTSDENELLFDTADLDLIVALILRGLETIGQG